MGGRLDGGANMKSLLVWLAALLVGTSLTFAACGGDDSTSTKANTPSGGDSGAGSATTTGGANTSATTAATTTGGSTPGSGQVTGSGADALRNLAKDISKKTYQVSYDLESTAADGKVTKSVITLAQKAPKTASWFTTGGATTPNAFFINDGTSSFVCTSTPPPGQCSKSKSDPTKPSPGGFSLESTLQALTENVTVAETDGKKIAGADSRCFTIKQASGGQASGGQLSDALACFSKGDGVATYVENKGANGVLTKITANKISTSVDDSVFAPPAGYKVVDAPVR